MSRKARSAPPSTPRSRALAAAKAVKSTRAVNYATSPLLATPTPPWRSKLLVAFAGLGFALLLGRAVFVQIVEAPFFLKQGEARYAHTIALQGSRGRVVDRNGELLAASVPARPGWVACAYRFVRMDTGQETALAPCGIVKIL